MGHLLTGGTINTLEEGGDDAFLEGELGLEGGDFRGEYFDLFFGRFDTFIGSILYAYNG